MRPKAEACTAGSDDIGMTFQHHMIYIRPMEGVGHQQSRDATSSDNDSERSGIILNHVYAAGFYLRDVLIDGTSRSFLVDSGDAEAVGYEAQHIDTHGLNWLILHHRQAMWMVNDRTSHFQTRELKVQA